MKFGVFHDQASAELEVAADWYERQRVGLGKQFELAIEETIQRICENPQAGSRYRATKFRYALVHRFPYVVFYSEDAHVIRIMAVAHGRRRPGY